MENPGFDPGASSLRTTRSSNWASPPCSVGYNSIANQNIKHNRPWRDLNPQSLAPETNALAIRPQGHKLLFFFCLFVCLLFVPPCILNQYKKKKKSNNTIKQKFTTAAGFEPTRAEPMRFLISRLNHSAMLSMFICNYKKNKFMYSTKAYNSK